MTETGLSVETAPQSPPRLEVDPAQDGEGKPEKQMVPLSQEERDQMLEPGHRPGHDGRREHLLAAPDDVPAQLRGVPHGRGQLPDQHLLARRHVRERERRGVVPLGPGRGPDRPDDAADDRREGRRRGHRRLHRLRRRRRAHRRLPADLHDRRHLHDRRQRVALLVQPRPHRRRRVPAAAVARLHDPAPGARAAGRPVVGHLQRRHRRGRGPPRRPRRARHRDHGRRRAPARDLADLDLRPGSADPPAGRRDHLRGPVRRGQVRAGAALPRDPGGGRPPDRAGAAAALRPGRVGRGGTPPGGRAGQAAGLLHGQGGPLRHRRARRRAAADGPRRHRSRRGRASGCWPGSGSARHRSW